MSPRNCGAADSGRNGALFRARRQVLQDRIAYMRVPCGAWQSVAGSPKVRAAEHFGQAQED